MPFVGSSVLLAAEKKSWSASWTEVRSKVKERTIDLKITTDVNATGGAICNYGSIIGVPTNEHTNKENATVPTGTTTNDNPMGNIPDGTDKVDITAVADVISHGDILSSSDNSDRSLNDKGKDNKDSSGVSNNSGDYNTKTEKPPFYVSVGKTTTIQRPIPTKGSLRGRRRKVDLDMYLREHPEEMTSNPVVQRYSDPGHAVPSVEIDTQQSMFNPYNFVGHSQPFIHIDLSNYLGDARSAVSRSYRSRANSCTGNGPSSNLGINRPSSNSLTNNNDDHNSGDSLVHTNSGSQGSFLYYYYPFPYPTFYTLPLTPSASVNDNDIANGNHNDFGVRNSNRYGYENSAQSGISRVNTICSQTRRQPQRRVNSIKNQLEYYFSPQNLLRDGHLQSLMDPTNGGVLLEDLVQFRRMRFMSGYSIEFLVEAFKSDPIPSLELIGNDTMIRLKNWRNWV
ncbi:hypothetical protein G9P44_001009 [Scheffersomyces stipitis]|nr:hypothetical protein G9P44_001009 [Scheffersomyces stipitis]